MKPVGNGPNNNFIGSKRCPMETYAGIDLHSSNNFIGVINDQDKGLYGIQKIGDVAELTYLQY
jgi:hypothetical protein